jgi:hypothetical protein
MAAFGDLDRTRGRLAREDSLRFSWVRLQSLEMIGEPGWDRTIDTLIKRKGEPRIAEIA